MQPEAYQHDYTAIEQRLKQLEAVALYKRLLGRSAFVLAVTVAACAFLLCAALAWRIVTQPNAVATLDGPAASPEVTDTARNLPDVPAVAEAEPGVVTTNFTLFRETQVEIGAGIYFVTAGHKYLTETDTTFANAWCYTRDLVDSVEIQIELGDLEPGSVPIASAVSPQTLAQTGLTQADHAKLFEGCPWLSGNPIVEDTVPPASISPEI